VKRKAFRFLFLNSFFIFLQRIVLDVLSSLIEILRPRFIRPIPLISMPKEEEHLFYQLIEIMESCDIHYQQTVVANNSFTNNSYFKKNGNFQKPWQKSFNNNNNNGNADNSAEKTIFLMDPDIEQLVTYRMPTVQQLMRGGISQQVTVMEKIKNHNYLSSDLKHLIYVEQRKFSIRRKVRKKNSYSVHCVFINFSFFF
jgi:hypothetical protein